MKKTHSDQLHELLLENTKMLESLEETKDLAYKKLELIFTVERRIEDPDTPKTKDDQKTKIHNQEQRKKLIAILDEIDKTQEELNKNREQLGGEKINNKNDDEYRKMLRYKKISDLNKNMKNLLFRKISDII